VKLRIRYAFHPDKLESKQPRIMEDFFDLPKDGQVAIVTMVADFHQRGLESRYVKKLKGLPIWELKTRSRGGIKGGTRLYFFIKDDNAIFVNCEVKDDDEASDEKLEEVADFLDAYRKGRKLF
jgi:hypothetical protein